MTKAVAKDPQERLDYTLDLTAPLTLDADTIATASVAVPAGITKDLEDHTDLEVVVWLSGGTHGINYPVTFTATTAGGRTYERTIEVRVRNR